MTYGEYIVVEFEEDVEIQAVTENAIGINDGDSNDLIWIPKSQLEAPGMFKVGQFFGMIAMTEWIAKQKGLLEE